MKTIRVTSLPDKGEVKRQILAENKWRHKKNRAKEEEIDSWLKSFPEIGEAVELENAQIHFCNSGIFGGWVSWDYANTYCLDINKEGKVSLGLIQSIGHRR